VLSAAALQFEELFSKYDRGNKGGLDWRDINDMIQGNMNIMDPAGWCVLLGGAAWPGRAGGCAACTSSVGCCLHAPTAQHRHQWRWLLTSEPRESCRIAERLEWWTTYFLCADKHGVISKEKIRGNFDGSIYYVIAEEIEGKRNRCAAEQAPCTLPEHAATVDARAVYAGGQAGV
jgi:peroxygenase